MYGFDVVWLMFDEDNDDGEEELMPIKYYLVD